MLHKINPLEQLLLRLNVLPHPVLDSVSGVVAGRALQVGAQLGVFDAMADKPRTTAAIASDVGIPIESLTVLLDCLVPLGYVKKAQTASYLLTSRGKKFLPRESPTSMRNMLAFSSMVFDGLSNLEECIRNGGPAEANLAQFTPEQWEMFTGAMREMARTNATEVARLVPLSDTDRALLDMGGSHGLYAIACCQRVSGMSAEVMDFEPVRMHAERTIAEHSMAGRVAFRAGDVLADDFTQEYDVILAFNLIHGLSTVANADLARKAFGALRPGGRYVILDQVKEAAGASDLSRFVSSTLGLMLLNQAGGRTFSLSEVQPWLEGAGFHDIAIKRPRTPGYALVVGRK